MLFRIRSSVSLTAVTFISLVAGCVITTTDGNSGTSNGTGGSTATSGGDEGGGGREPGTGGTGGSGGADVGVGGGGAGGSEPTACVLDQNNDKDVNSCKAMNITPASAGGAASQCGDPATPYDPPGYTTCLSAFDVYTAGAAQHLQACLSEITVEPANACSDDLNAACIQKMYDAASDKLCNKYIAAAETICKDIATACADAGDTSMDVKAVAACTYLTTPLQDATVEKLYECFNSDETMGNCKEAFDTCEEEIRQ